VNFIAIAVQTSDRPLIEMPARQSSRALLQPPYITTLEEFERWKKRGPRNVHAVRGQCNHILRPPNSYFVFRTHYCQIMPSDNENLQTNISKRAALAWRLLSSEEKMPFEVIADSLREDHKRVHPQYKYAPNRTKINHQRNRKAREEDEDEREEQSIEVVACALGIDVEVAKAKASRHVPKVLELHTIRRSRTSSHPTSASRRVPNYDEDWPYSESDESKYAPPSRALSVQTAPSTTVYSPTLTARSLASPTPWVTKLEFIEV
jgi:hypothetical protein